jgi:hypothetical protein
VGDVAKFVFEFGRLGFANLLCKVFQEGIKLVFLDETDSVA